MISHQNARLGYTGRVCLVERVRRGHWTVEARRPHSGLAPRVSVSGCGGIGRKAVPDSSIAPPARATRPARLRPALERRISQLRAQRKSGPAIADAHGLPLSTVGDVLRRLGLGRLPRSSRGPRSSATSAHPGELLHLDVKKLGRIGPFQRAWARARGRLQAHQRHSGYRQAALGREYLHVAIDDRGLCRMW